MKKLVAMALCGTMLASVLGGCGAVKSPTATSQAASSTTTEASAATTEAAEGGTEATDADVDVSNATYHMNIGSAVSDTNPSTIALKSFAK